MTKFLPTDLHEDSKRAAKFTASPKQLYSNLEADPIFPTQTMPVFIPIPISTSNSASCMSCCIWRAVSIASCSWLSTSSGAFHTAIIASPIYLSTIPPFLCTASAWTVKALFIIFITSSGSNFSDRLVKPLTSVNIIVHLFLSPPNFKSSGFFCSLATCLGSR